ncbi:hypothetical protein B0A48_09867 [Cryoendolithus antarcticus]|uniref:Adenosine kinase n=1 Tax=Cryoendolithus antarcticus TaxID=1507870 RepID=A0A1V8T2Y1_9PEZI|nr:hypothetical protein B0A48_09867 [Cryoendolithus antarcticus]
MASHQYQLLCLENPILDIISKKDGRALLEEYALDPNGFTMADDKHKSIYDKLLSDPNAVLTAGGAAQNTARGVQYILEPDSVVYFGCVGNDEYAEKLQEANKKVGLKVFYRVDEKEPTGRCGVVVTDHNRSLVTDLAAANCYKVEHLKEHWDVVENSKAYFVGGYHLTVCVPAVMALAEDAAKNNKPFALSLNAPFICQFFKDPLDQTAPYWDYIVGNETEAVAYAEAHSLDLKAPQEIVKHLANLPKKNTQRKRVAIITQGTEPTLVAVQGEDEVKSYPVHPIDKNKIEDTTGAGDAFAAGFFAGVAKGESLEKCVDMGQWLAALGIQEQGPGYPFPKQTYKASS